MKNEKTQDQEVDDCGFIVPKPEVIPEPPTAEYLPVEAGRDAVTIDSPSPKYEWLEAPTGLFIAGMASILILTDSRQVIEKTDGLPLIAEPARTYFTSLDTGLITMLFAVFFFFIVWLGLRPSVIYDVGRKLLTFSMGVVVWTVAIFIALPAWLFANAIMLS